MPLPRPIAAEGFVTLNQQQEPLAKQLLFRGPLILRLSGRETGRWFGLHGGNGGHDGRSPLRVEAATGEIRSQLS